MFNPNLEKIFQQKHVTLIICYDRDCHQNLYDNLYCDLEDEDLDFFEVKLDADMQKEPDEEPYDLSIDIQDQLSDEFGGAITPAHLLIDLEKVQSYYCQPSHYEELCAQLLKLNAIAQTQNVSIVLTITINDPYSSATTAANYIKQHAPKQNTDFILFAMTNKNPSQLTYANGNQADQIIDLDAFPNA